VVVNRKPGLVAELVSLGLGQVVSGHLFDQDVESDFRDPAQVLAGFGRLSEQGVHFRGAEIPGVYGHDGFVGGRIDADFINARALPLEGHAQFGGAQVHKFTDGVLFACSNDIVVRKVLLEHEPLHLHVVFGVAPVAFCVEVAQVQAVLEA